MREFFPSAALPGVLWKAQPMSTYEYTTSVITHGFLGRKEDELDRQELARELNRMGAEGWELVKVLTGMALHREKDGHLLLFKRHAS